MATKVLAVDDEKIIIKGLKFSLERDGFDVVCAYDADEALALAESEKPDIILLDVMLPGLSGYEVCERIREYSDVPIIMLSAKGEDMDKIMGLEYGADDYITKPYNILEVKARIKAVLRRRGSNDKKENSSNEIVYGLFRLNLDSRTLYIDGRDADLTVIEFNLLEAMAKQPNKVFSRQDLLKIVRGEVDKADARSIDVHIRRLREKIEENPSSPKYVHTKWGVGYYFHA
ncbi:response regulator transcription factor [Howardella ureilytica]|nr:response regulator transcription factor [Lachnospiraceae bacterium]MDY2956287.1 response regulator transcription factor [Lachnospiraceae bacterium]